MKKMIVFVPMIYVSFLLSCSTFPKTEKGNIDIRQFDLLKLHQSKSDVLKILGYSSKSRMEGGEELWFYAENDDDGVQRGTIAFDVNTNQVSGITVIPRETDQEIHLSYLKEKKFNSSVFEKIPLGRCQRDYIPREEFYVNKSEGIIIEYNYVHKTVESYSQSSSTYVMEFANQLKTCKR